MTPEGGRRNREWGIPLRYFGRSWTQDQALAHATQGSSGAGYYTTWLTAAREARKRFPRPGEAEKFLLSEIPKLAGEWAMRVRRRPFGRVTSKDLGRYLDTQMTTKESNNQ